MEKVDLSAFFLTKAQAVDFGSRLSSVAEKIYKTDFQFEQAFSEEFGVQKKDKFLSLLRTQHISLDAHEALKNFMTTLQETINAMTTVSLVLAFEPPTASLMAIAEWFVMNMGQQVLIDVRVDPSIIGGATIDYNGRHVDFSIKPTFDHILKEMLSPPPKVAAAHQAAQEQPNPSPPAHT